MVLAVLSPLLISKMCRQQVVLRSSAVMTIIAILTISNIEMSSASSLRAQDGYWWTRPDITKRNSWWSKKSVESEPEYPGLKTESTYPFDDIVLNGAADTAGYTLLFRCYISECVPEFVLCMQKSSSLEDSSECKKKHELCARLCGAFNTQNILV